MRSDIDPQDSRPHGDVGLHDTEPVLLSQLSEEPRREAVAEEEVSQAMKEIAEAIQRLVDAGLIPNREAKFTAWVNGDATEGRVKELLPDCPATTETETETKSNEKEQNRNGH